VYRSDEKTEEIFKDICYQKKEDMLSGSSDNKIRDMVWSIIYSNEVIGQKLR